MEGKSLVVGVTYLFRRKGKQVPVIFLRKPYPMDPMLIFLDVATGKEFPRRVASALSKHFDSCAIGRESCDCAARLAALGKTV